MLYIQIFIEIPNDGENMYKFPSLSCQDAAPAAIPGVPNTKISTFIYKIATKKVRKNKTKKEPEPPTN
jgi:hypothetical protein